MKDIRWKFTKFYSRDELRSYEHFTSLLRDSSSESFRGIYEQAGCHLKEFKYFNCTMDDELFHVFYSAVVNEFNFSDSQTVPKLFRPSQSHFSLQPFKFTALLEFKVN